MFCLKYYVSNVLNFVFQKFDFYPQLRLRAVGDFNASAKEIRC